MRSFTPIFYLCCFSILLLSCKGKIKQNEDEIYSRHLQRYLKLVVITTPMPEQKEDMNLLLFNGYGTLKKMDAAKIVDSLFKKRLIEPLTIIGIDGVESSDYGIAGMTANGKVSKTEKYTDFVINELYPFAKKKVSLRKFKSVAIAGAWTAGISAFDIAWNNADKIDKVGVFSGNYDYAGKADTLNNVLQFVQASRKRPKMKFWLFASENADSTVYNNTLEFGKLLQTKKTIATDDITIVADQQGNNNLAAWRNQFAAFLIWAFGK